MRETMVEIPKPEPKLWVRFRGNYKDFEFGKTYELPAGAAAEYVALGLAENADAPKGE